MQFELRAHGAHLDDVRYCPHHPDGTVPGYARACDWRKPGPGMLLDLMRAWPVDAARSVLIGDRPSDLAAAAASGVRGISYVEGGLTEIVQAALGCDEGHSIARS